LAVETENESTEIQENARQNPGSNPKVIPMYRGVSRGGLGWPRPQNNVPLKYM